MEGCAHDQEFAGGADVGEALCHWVAGPGMGGAAVMVGGGIPPGIGGALMVGG